MRKASSFASVVMALWLCCGFAALAAESQVITIAVLPFENVCKNPDFNWLAHGFAETLATKLSNISTIQLVERNQLAKALQELKLQDTAVIDPKTAAKLGKIVGAKYVIIGSYQKAGDALKVDARRVEVETSVASSGVDVAGKYSNLGVFSLQSSLALKVASALKKTPTETESQAMAKPPTKSLKAYEWFAKGNEQCRKSDYDGAVASYSRAIALDPNFAEAYCGRGIVYGGKGDYDRAIADYDKAIAIDPNDDEVYFCRGMYYQFNKRDYERASADYGRAIALNSNYSDAYYFRALAYESKGDHDRAMADFDKLIAIDPKSATGYFGRANAYYDKGDYDRAVADYTKAISMDPNYPYPKPYYDRGRAYYYKGDYGRAIADFDRALTLSTKRWELPDFYYFKGLAAAAAKRNREALEAFRRFVEIEIAPAGDPKTEAARRMIEELEGTREP